MTWSRFPFHAIFLVRVDYLISEFIASTIGTVQHIQLHDIRS